MNTETFAIGDNRYTVIPSGFRDIRILVAEDPAYNLDVSYLTDKDYEEMKDVVRDEAAPWMQCLACGWEGPLTHCSLAEVGGGQECPACGAIALAIDVKKEKVDRGDTPMECPACEWEGPLKECDTISGNVDCCPACGTFTHVIPPPDAAPITQEDMPDAA